MRLGDNRPGCPGIHRYSLQGKGLSEESVRAAYEGVRPFWEDMWDWQRCAPCCCA